MLYSAASLLLKWLFVLAAGSRVQLKESSRGMSLCHGRGYRDPCKLESNLAPWLHRIPNIFTPRFLSSIGFIPDFLMGLSPDCGEFGFPW